MMTGMNWLRPCSRFRNSIPPMPGIRTSARIRWTSFSSSTLSAPSARATTVKSNSRFSSSSSSCSSERSRTSASAASSSTNRIRNPDAVVPDEQHSLVRPLHHADFHIRRAPINGELQRVSDKVVQHLKEVDAVASQCGKTIGHAHPCALPFDKPLAALEDITGHLSRIDSRNHFGHGPDASQLQNLFDPAHQELAGFLNQA